MSTRSAFLLLVVLAALSLALRPCGLLAAREGETARYLGSEKCKMCHGEQYKAWLGLKHSTAWKTLTPEDLAGRKDVAGHLCVRCHTTGFGKPGGFVSFESTPKLVNVGCEACHGPGSTHATLMLQSAMLDGDEKKQMEARARAAVTRKTDCTECHNPHVSHKALYGKKPEEGK